MTTLKDLLNDFAHEIAKETKIAQTDEELEHAIEVYTDACLDIIKTRLIGE